MYDNNALYNLSTNFAMDEHICIYISGGCRDHCTNSDSLHILRPAMNSCNQHNLSNATADMSLDFQLVKIKVRAASCTHKLQAIEQVRNGWELSEDEGLAKLRDDIGLQIEYAIHTFEETVTMTEQLLSHPPGYDNNPSEKRQRQLEVLVLGASAHDYVVDLQKKLIELKHQVNDAFNTRVREACSRAKQIHIEAHDILNAAKKLHVEEGTQ